MYVGNKFYKLIAKINSQYNIGIQLQYSYNRSSFLEKKINK